MNFNQRFLAAAIVVPLLAGTIGAAQAQDSKNVRIVVGSSAGGGFDAFGRLAGRNMGQYLPGKPNIVVNLLTAHSDIFRPLIVSKKTPAAKLAILRKGMWEMVNGKPFLDDAKRSGRTVISPLKGEDIEKMIADLYETPANLVTEAARAVE